MTTIVFVGAAVALVVGVLAIRLGTRTLRNRDLNPTGGLDNLAVTLLGIGAILLGWATAGPVVYVLST